MSDPDPDAVRRDFADAVTMAPAELERWLASPESESVGWSGDSTKTSAGGDESVGHASGRRIVDLLRTNKADLTEDDLAHMRKVSGYVKRHLAQGPPAHGVEHSRWRASLMNWGHDPLKG